MPDRVRQPYIAAMKNISRPLRVPVRVEAAFDVAANKVLGGRSMCGAIADLGSAALITICLAPVGATLLTAAMYVHVKKALPGCQLTRCPRSLEISW